MNRIHRLRGFTLVELLVTVAIGGILLALAIPGLGELIARNTMTTAVNSLIVSMQLARSEAVTRGAPVVVCPDDPDTAAPDCDPAKNWSGGYVVFADDDDNRALASAADVIRSIPGPGAGFTIASEETTISYRDDGTAAEGASDTNGDGRITLAVRDPDSVAEARNVDISLLGRPACRRPCGGGVWVRCTAACP